MAEDTGGCTNCGQRGEMPEMSWGQVLAQFARSMVQWVSRGVPIVDDKIHGQRNGKCGVCPFKVGHWCKKCKCLTYLKTKLATEGCPDKPSRWLPRA